MDAKFGLLAAVFAVVTSLGAGYRTENFIVHAGTPQFAQAVGEEAERLRSKLSVKLLGHELPPWPDPCPIRVYTGPRTAARGSTTYSPDRGVVRNFLMEIHGTPERVLDSVLPHEVTHTVLATHFGGPVPRWADEGLSTTFEHAEERHRHDELLRQFLSSRRGIPMNDLFRLREYPPDMLPMYSQGYSVVQYLIAQGGHQKFVMFLEDYMRLQSWTQSLRKHYGYESIAAFQDQWLSWVAAGSKEVPSVGQVGVVAATGPRTAPFERVADARPLSDDGWYARQRQEVVAREASDTLSASPSSTPRIPLKR